MGRASRAKRERRAKRVRGVDAGRDQGAPAVSVAVEQVRGWHRGGVRVEDPVRGPNSRGGRREGAGRPRVYATNAERQAAYRARLRAKVAGLKDRVAPSQGPSR